MIDDWLYCSFRFDHNNGLFRVVECDDGKADDLMMIEWLTKTSEDVKYEMDSNDKQADGSSYIDARCARYGDVMLVRFRDVKTVVDKHEIKH